MNDDTRQALLDTLSRRLQDMDSATLQQLAVLTEPAGGQATIGPDPVAAEVTRRQFLTGALVGGAGGLMVAGGGGLAVLSLRQVENFKLQALLRLYETLEQVGIDAIVGAGIGGLGTVLQGLEGGSRLVKSGLDAAESALQRFTSIFPAVRNGILWTERLVSGLSDKLQLLEDAVGSVLNRASPITEALGDFFNRVLSLLPDTIENPIRDTLSRMETVITSVPEAVEGINTFLLRPLRAYWFGEDAAAQLEHTLIDPLVTGLFDPLEAHLSAVAGVFDTWQTTLVKPVQQAIVQREAIRGQIAQYKQDNGLGSTA